MTPPVATGLFVALFDLSEEMNRDVEGPTGTFPAHLTANDFINRLLEGLIAAGDTGIAFEIALLGIRPTSDGVEILRLLHGANTRSTIPLAEIALEELAESGEDLPRNFTQLFNPFGEPGPTEALAFAYRLVARWLAGKPNARAPVIVHCTSGLGFDEEYFRHLRSLSALSSAHGPPRIWHARFAPAEVPESEAYAPASNSGSSWNTYPIEEVWNLLFEERPTIDQAIVELTNAPAFEMLREFWLQKRGNEPQHWEDGFAVDAEAGTAVVCDGASEGIFCRTWAELLSKKFLELRPDVANLAEFVSTCRAEWQQRIDYHALKWSAQNKVDGTGAAATLCALALGPASENGARPWRALAVGDAVLFRVRAGKPWLSFPLVIKDQLDSAPDLLRTLRRGGSIAAIAAEGRCLPGDLFLLATDAVAGHLFTLGDSLDKYASMSAEDWAAEIEMLRMEGKIVNDDCTLLVLRVPAVVSEPVSLALRVQTVLREVSPSLGLDGNEIEVVEVFNGIASVRLGAVCGSCPNTMSAVVSALEAELKLRIPEVDMIEAVI